MDAATPKTPWHRKRTGWLVIAAWLLLPAVYVAATGPVMYAETAGWVPRDTYLVMFRPLYRAVFPVHGGDGPVVRGDQRPERLRTLVVGPRARVPPRLDRRFVLLTEVLTRLHRLGSTPEVSAMDYWDEGLRKAVRALIPEVEGRPVVNIGGCEGGVYVCRRIGGLHTTEDSFNGGCEWVDPEGVRPDELTDEMSISCDCVRLGPGWWLDTYFRWYFVYDPRLVARSLAGDHSWVTPFLGLPWGGRGSSVEPGADLGSPGE